MTSVHAIKCRKTGETLGMRLEGGWCVCTTGRCLFEEERKTTTIPVYIAHPTAETNGEQVRWMPGQKAKFTSASGKTEIVTIMTGERVRNLDAADAICIEVTFDEDGGKAYCVRAKQLRIV